MVLLCDQLKVLINVLQELLVFELHYLWWDGRADRLSRGEISLVMIW